MSESVRPPALLPGDTLSRWSVWRTWLFRTFPGRALVLGIAIKVITWPLGFAITLPAWLDAIDMVGSLALLFGRRLRPDAPGGVGETAAAVARPPQADPVVRVRRRGAGAAGDDVLPAGRPDPRVQRQLVSRAVARPQPDGPGALPRANRAARSAAQRHAGSDGRSARAAPGQYRDPLSICLARRDSREGIGVHGGNVQPHARTAADRRAADRGRPLGPLAATGHAAEVGRVRRLRRHRGVQRAFRRRCKRAGEHAAR